MSKPTMKLHGRYNWKGQPERLVYIGHNWSGNGYWHQFEKVDQPGRVWCEVQDSDLPMIEETAQPSDPIEDLIVKKLSAKSEIAAWNEAVEARKAAKKARKATKEPR